MDRDKILRLAREAGFEQQMRHRDGGVTVLPDAMFVRFAALVRAEALEEAAKRCVTAIHAIPRDHRTSADVLIHEMQCAIRAQEGSLYRV